MRASRGVVWLPAIGLLTIALGLGGCAVGPAAGSASGAPGSLAAADGPGTPSGQGPGGPAAAGTGATTGAPTTLPAADPASTPTPAPSAATPSAPVASTKPPPGAPVIVIDPGHSRTVDATDPATGLIVSDYENEPEMRDVFAVAQVVAAALRADGYRVVMTKTSVGQRRSLLQRAQIANAAHAALALSIHDQAGASGGIGFRAGNNIVYYQRVGDYRQNPAGTRIVFTDRAVAALSQAYAKVFAAAREHAQGVPVRLQGDTGYDLGSRGLAPGNIWTVQLLSHVPWVYNEAGGNSAGRVGLDAADEHTYAAGLVAAVEKCVPIQR